MPVVGGGDASFDQLIVEIKDLQKQLAGQTDITISTAQQAKIKAQIKQAYDDLALLTSLTDDQKKSYDKQLKSLDKNVTAAGKLLNTHKGITGTLREAATESKDFLKSVDQWFKKGEQIAQQYLSVSKSIGLTQNQTKILSSNFRDTVKESMRLGVSLDGLETIYKSFNEETGRARTLASDEAINIAKLVGGLGMFESEAVKLAESFDLMGISSADMAGHLDDVMVSSSKMGLNSGKVVKVLQTNMKQMQQYSFKGGVKGMIEMSKLAVKMRMDVGEMLGMADKFYQPEGAIEAAANLQLLGGDIAEAFGDPFETMYLARNKPEELAKKVGEMTASMVSFNKETGEFDMPAEARMQLQAVSKELGMSMESLTTMTRQAAKIKEIEINVGGDIADPETREAIAGMARMKGGKWVVDVMDENGKAQATAIDQLSKTQAKDILERKDLKEDTTEKDFLSQIAINTQSFTERVKNEKDSQQFGFAAKTDVYGASMDGFLKNSVNNLGTHMDEMFGTLNEAVGGAGGIGKVMADGMGVTGNESFMDSLLDTMMQNLTASISDNVSNGVLDVKQMGVDADNVIFNIGGVTGANDLKMGSDKTVVMGPAGAFSLNKDDKYVGADGNFMAGTNLFDPSLGVSSKPSSSSSSINVGPITLNGKIEVSGGGNSGSGGEVDASVFQALIQQMIDNTLNGTTHSGGKRGSGGASV